MEAIRTLINGLVRIILTILYITGALALVYIVFIFILLCLSV